MFQIKKKIFFDIRIKTKDQFKFSRIDVTGYSRY